MPSSTIFTIDSPILPFGKPTATTLPPARKLSTAWLKAIWETAVTTAAWTPPNWSCVNFPESAFFKLKIKSAAISFAYFNLSSLISIARVLNTFFTHWIARFPNPSHP